MNIVTIIGARPQFIKAAVVSRAFLDCGNGVKEKIVHTGQHYDSNMSDVFFSELDIPKPAYNLGIGGGTHGQNTGRMLEEIESLYMKEKPDAVLVYGDTDSTLAGALAAAKLHIPVAHVEAGLRSFNKKMPEEINRILTDHVATILFPPTKISLNNLIKENIPPEKCYVVGDVMYDAALYYGSKSRQPSFMRELGSQGKGFLLCTIHRAENTNDVNRLKGIFDGLATSKLKIILPLHPRTAKLISTLGVVVPPTVHVVEPVGYLEMVWLEMNSKAIITDSGGVQKEAYFHRKPCITLRDETEWVELVESRVNVLVGADSEKISQALAEINPFHENSFFYGEGKSAEKIVEKILEI